MASEMANEPGRVYRREAFGLGVLVVIGVLTFTLTRAFAAANRRMHLDDAARWFQAAQARTGAGDAAGAVGPLRRAVAIDRDNTHYRLALASALAASGQDEAARQLLVTLRQFTPEDPDINLQLARLEGRRQDLTATIQYYQNALYGLWPANRIDERRSVRRELIDYLLAHGQRRRALSELLIFSANSPDDPASQRQLGELLMRAGDPQRAVDHFTRALRLAPGDRQTLVSAGTAAFEAGDYVMARKYFRSVPALSGSAADMRDIAEIVVTQDPLAARLKIDDRYRRLQVGLDVVSRRLTGCGEPAAPQQQELAAFREAATRRAVRADPDLIDQGVDLIGRLEGAAAQCGSTSAADRAWQAIAARHGGNEL